MAASNYQHERPPPTPYFEFKGNLAEVAYDNPKAFAKLISPYSGKPICDLQSEQILSQLTDMLNYHNIGQQVEEGLVRLNALHIAVRNVRVAREETMAVIKILLELGVLTDGPLTQSSCGFPSKRYVAKTPLNEAMQNVDVELLKMFCDAGIDPYDYLYLKKLKPFVYEECDATSRLQAIAVMHQYVYEGMPSISRLLIEGKHYALYARMRSGMIAAKDFYVLHNGKTFMEWATIFDNFSGFPEMIYRYGVELSMVRYSISRPRSVRYGDISFSPLAVEAALDTFQRKLRGANQRMDDIDDCMVINHLRLEHHSGVTFQFSLEDDPSDVAGSSKNQQASKRSRSQGDDESGDETKRARSEEVEYLQAEVDFEDSSSSDDDNGDEGIFSSDDSETTTDSGLIREMSDDEDGESDRVKVLTVPVVLPSIENVPSAQPLISSDLTVREAVDGSRVTSTHVGQNLYSFHESLRAGGNVQQPQEEESNKEELDTTVSTESGFQSPEKLD